MGRGRGCGPRDGSGRGRGNGRGNGGQGKGMGRGYKDGTGQGRFDGGGSDYNKNSTPNPSSRPKRLYKNASNRYSESTERKGLDRFGIRGTPDCRNYFELEQTEKKLKTSPNTPYWLKWWRFAIKDDDDDDKNKTRKTQNPQENPTPRNFNGSGLGFTRMTYGRGMGRGLGNRDSPDCINAYPKLI